jgi:hypothetical protein
MRIIYLMLIVPMAANAQLHGTHPDWLHPPLPVSQSDPGAFTNGAVANNMAVTADGRVLILYTESQGNLERRSIVGSADNGLSWVSPPPTLFDVMEQTPSNTLPSMDIGTDDRLHVIWASRVKKAVYHVWADAQDLVWSDTLRIGQTVKDKFGFCQVSTDRSGRVHAYWHEGDAQTAQTAETVYARSLDGGLTWQPQQMLSADDGRHSAFPSGDFAGADGDTLAIAWRDSIGVTTQFVQDWDVQMAVTTDGGATWGQPFTVAGGPGMQSDPGVVIDRNGHIHVAYHEYPQAGGNLAARVWYVHSTDLGADWGSPAMISEPGVQSHLVKAAYDHANDRVWYCYKDQRDYQGPSDRRADLQMVHISGDASSISTPEFITDADSNEVGLHNIKVGPDGIPHVHFFIKPHGTDSTHIWYTMRNVVTAVGNAGTFQPLLAWPVPSSGMVSFSRTVNNLMVFDLQGALRLKLKGPVRSVDLTELPYGMFVARCNEGTLRLVHAP